MLCYLDILAFEASSRWDRYKLNLRNSSPLLVFLYIEIHQFSRIMILFQHICIQLLQQKNFYSYPKSTPMVYITAKYRVDTQKRCESHTNTRKYPLYRYLPRLCNCVFPAMDCLRNVALQVSSCFSANPSKRIILIWDIPYLISLPGYYIIRLFVSQPGGASSM